MAPILKTLFLILSGALLGLTLGLTGCVMEPLSEETKSKAAPTEPVVKRPITNLFIQKAASGSIQLKEADKKLYVLSLYSVEDFTLEFSDQKTKKVGVVTTGEFISQWGLQAKDQDPLSGSLEVINGNPEGDVFLFKLMNPRYDKVGAGLVFDIQPLDKALPELVTFREAVLVVELEQKEVL